MEKRKENRLQNLYYVDVTNESYLSIQINSWQFSAWYLLASWLLE
jgi:cytidylate kinase